jgi:hypothetical protein
MPKSTGSRAKAAEHTALSPGALSVLRHKLRIEGLAVKLTEQLDRALYEEMDEVLTRLGGTYIQGSRIHEFPYDPGPHIEAVLACGAMPEKNPLSFFYTTPPVLEAIRWILDQERNDAMHRLYYWQEDRARPMRILEPSAGLGHMAELARDLFPKATIECCELDPYRRSVLVAKGFRVVAEDFLHYRPQQPYDVVLINPPFSLGSESDTYIQHIWRAMEMLADEEESTLIALAPNGFTFDARPRFSEFFTFALEHGVLERLPADAFKESGTTVQTVLLWLGKRLLPDFVNMDEPWWGYPNRRVGRLLEWVHMDADYYHQLEHILVRMTGGSLTVYSNGRPGPDARAAIIAFFRDVVERSRLDFNHFPQLPADSELLVQEVMEQYQEDYDYHLERLRQQHEAEKQRRLERAQVAIDQNRAAIARTRARIAELEQSIARREAGEPPLIAAYHELAARIAQEPAYVPPMRPNPPPPPPPTTLFDLLEESA